MIKMKKKRWSNKPWVPEKKILKDIHFYRTRLNLSYREIAGIYGMNYNAIRKYYFRWLNRPWYIKLFGLIK